MPTTLVLILAALILAGCCFYLGYDVARSWGEKVAKDLHHRLQWEQQNKHELSRWVNQNWPDEYAAYARGHSDGYQQGILQSPEMSHDDE